MCMCIISFAKIRFKLHKLVQKLVSEGEKSLFEALEIQNFPGEACIQTPLAAQCSSLPPNIHLWLRHWTWRNKIEGKKIWVYYQRRQSISVKSLIHRRFLSFSIALFRNSCDQVWEVVAKILSISLSELGQKPQSYPSIKILKSGGLNYHCRGALYLSYWNVKHIEMDRGFWD